MYKQKRTMALMISLVMIFSILISPFSIVYASAPAMKPPSIEIPAINQFGDLTPVIKEPEISRPTNKETAARAKGVSYKLKEGVEVLPSNIDYGLKQISLEELASYKGVSSNGGMKLDQPMDINKIDGLKHVPGSKFMVVPKDAASAFIPKKDRIYLDKDKGLAYRVLEEGKTDQEGNDQYVVGNPNLTEIFESYTIPAQDIKLTTGNIAYMAPGVVLAPGSGMRRNLVAAAGDNGYISGYKHEGNKHILNLTANKIIFQYPSAEAEKKTKEEEEKAKKEKFEGDWWEAEKGTDLKGFESEDKLSVKVAIKKGTITIEDPTFHADFDFNLLTTHAAADFYFESKTVADVTFEGDVSINKSMEACIFGYDIDLGSVFGEEKGNRAYVGIFLVIGANGKVHVEARTTSTGNARAGYEYKAFGYGFIPYSVGPYVRYQPTGFDVDFKVDGEIHLVMACVPQVGVIIWGHEIGALQIWLGYKADAVFSASGGGGSTTDTAAVVKGSADINAFAEMIGILFDKKYTIFHLDFPIYKGEWILGEEISGEGGDAVREVSPSFFVKADASTNIVEGQIVYGKDAKPFSNKKYAVELWNAGQLKASLPGTTEGDGRFIMDTAAYNLIPKDKVVINIDQGEVFGLDVGEYFIEGEMKYKLTETKSKEVKPTVPFTSLDFNVDTFNDVVTGTVLGQYTGPVDVIVRKWEGLKETGYAANAVNGVFALQTAIDESVYGVTCEINFEGTKYPENRSVFKEPNLDALDIHFYNEYAEAAGNAGTKTKGFGTKRPSTGISEADRYRKLPVSEMEKEAKISEDDFGNKIIRPTKVYGTITNSGEMGLVEIQGEDYIRESGNGNITVKAYTGDVKLSSYPIMNAMLAAINHRTGTYEDPLVSATGGTATTKAQPVIIDGRSFTGSSFEFNNPEALAYELEIEHEGLTKTIKYNPFKFHYDTTFDNIDIIAKQPVQNAETLVTEDKKDAIVNPGDIMIPGDMMNPGNIMDNLNQGNAMKQSSTAPSVNTANQWNATWMTQMGSMQLTQTGNTIEGTITKGTASYLLQGTVTDGVFKGSIMVPSTTSIFGDIISIEMDISSDGNSINFKNIGVGTEMRGLNGTKAIRQ